MKEMEDMPEMMKKEMMKKMKEYGSMNAMKEGFSSAAQRKAAYASGYKGKEKGEGAMKRGSNLDTYKPKPKEEMEEMSKMNAKHVPGHKETAVNAMAMNAMKKEMAKKEMMKMAMKMPIQSMYGKMNAMKTGDDDLTPMNNMKLNAMIKDPHKSKGDDPKKDMNATYMKSDVRGDVKNGGGTDMSKVNDNPKPMAAMKKINAMYGESNRPHRYLETKPGSLEEAVLISRGLVEKNLTEARYEVSHDYGSRFGSFGVKLTAVVDASSPQDAMKKGHDKLEKLSMSSKAEKLGVDELQDPDDEGKPTVKTTSQSISYTDMKKF
jgi:hypothetical protein